jgi:transcriptional regulator with XRE-family HTH domain
VADRRILLLGKKIRKTRREKGFSQETLAYEAELDRAYVGKIERGEKNITIAKLLQISDALDIPLYELFDF